MTRDEIRELIGGYATGTLSDAERKILFEAALEEQALFNELAGEQALKEALEEPGAKQRLLLALGRKTLVPKPWWKTTWAWTAIGAASVALVAGIALMRPAAKVEQVARLEIPVLPSPPGPELAPVPPSVAAPAPPAPKLAAPVAKALAREAEPPKEAAAAARSTDSIAAVNLPKAAAPVPPAAPQAVPFAPQAFAQGTIGGVAGALTAPAPPLSTQAAPAPAQVPGAGGGGGGGGRGGGRGGRGGAARVLAQLAPAPRFAFDYSVTPEGVLRIVPAANGFLAVYSNNGSAVQGLFFNRPLQAGVATEVPLPPDCVQATAVFSARERSAGSLSGAGPMDPASGTKSDPNPSPDSVLIASIPVKR